MITPSMVEAAESAYMPFGDMELAIRAALHSAKDFNPDDVWPALRALDSLQGLINTDTEEGAAKLSEVRQQLHKATCSLSGVAPSSMEWQEKFSLPFGKDVALCIHGMVFIGHYHKSGCVRQSRGSTYIITDFKFADIAGWYPIPEADNS